MSHNRTDAASRCHFDICKLFRQQMGLQEWEPPFTMLFPDSYKAFCNKKIILGKNPGHNTSSPLETPAVAATCFVGWMSTDFKPTRALTLPSRYPGPSKMQLLSLTPVVVWKCFQWQHLQYSFCPVWYYHHFGWRISFSRLFGRPKVLDTFFPTPFVLGGIFPADLTNRKP